MNINSVFNPTIKFQTPTYKIPHGQVCGMLLPHVLRFNSVSVKERVEYISSTLGSDDIYKDLSDLLDDIGLTVKLTDFGYKEDHMETIIDETLASAQAPTNPRSPERNDIADIVKRII